MGARGLPPRNAKRVAAATRSVRARDQLVHHRTPNAGYTVGITALNVSIALFIEYSIRNAERTMGRVLNSRIAVGLGTLSYSMYLWQQLFFESHPNNVIQTFPINLLFVVAVSAASYVALEKPLLAWRRRLARA